MLLHSLGVALLSVAAVGSVPSHPPGTSIRQPLRSKPVALYSAHQMEAYLSAEDVAYIRPGYNITLVSFQIPADRRPVAEVKFTDDLNQPLDRLGQATPGAVSASFILSWYDAANRDYVAYTKRTQTSPITGQAAVQASADSGGQWTEVTLGTYRYRFGTTLPAGFDQTKTHTLGIYGSRNVSDDHREELLRNLLYDFRPDGGAVTAKWDAVATATCNCLSRPARPPRRLAPRGQALRAVPQQDAVDRPGHRQHGRDALDDPQDPQRSEPEPTATRSSASADAVHDYSHVTYPQDVRNCATCHEATTSPEGTSGTPTRPAWPAAPATTTSTGTTGENHVAGPLFDDHALRQLPPARGRERVRRLDQGRPHHPDQVRRSSRASTIEIMSVTNTAPGAEADGDCSSSRTRDGMVVAPSSLNSFRTSCLGGPTIDYTSYFREDCQDALDVASGGTCDATPSPTPFPAGATGTWTLVRGRTTATSRSHHADAERGDPRGRRYNPIFNVLVTDAPGDVPPRTVVDPRQVQRVPRRRSPCTAASAPRSRSASSATTRTRPTRPPSAARAGRDGPLQVDDPPDPHRRGAHPRLHDLRLRRHAHNYNEVLYPGDRRNCETCHVAGSYGPAVARRAAADADAARLRARSGARVRPPASSCHDSLDAAAHAYVNTAPFGEACASCHGDERDGRVDKVHAR